MEEYITPERTANAIMQDTQLDFIPFRQKRQ